MHEFRSGFFDHPRFSACDWSQSKNRQEHRASQFLLHYPQISCFTDPALSWLTLQTTEPMRSPSRLIWSVCRLMRLYSSGFVETENLRGDYMYVVKEISD